MKRLLMLSVLTLGLTSCPQNTAPPPPLSIPSGTAALHGSFAGTLTQSLSGGPRTARSPQAVYRLLEEGSYGHPRRTFSLVMQRLDSGAVLGRAKLGGTPHALGFRAAVNGAPARLLVQSRSDGQILIEERDPDTLELRSEWSFPMSTAFPDPNMYSQNFTPDGRVFASPDGQLIDTLTRQALPVHPDIQAQVARTAGHNGHLTWSPDARWLEVTTYVPGPFGSGDFRYNFISNASGQKLSGAPLHPVGCGLKGSSWSSQILGLPDGGAALTFQDGVVELRRADGSLRQAVSLGSCSPFWFQQGGDEISLSSGKDSARIRVADGAVLPGVLPDPALPSLKLTLDMQAKYISETEYESSGTATLDGEAYSLKVKASSHGIQLRPQMSQVTYFVSWIGELRRGDGTVYATLSGNHGATGTGQGVRLELSEPQVGFDYFGPMKR